MAEYETKAAFDVAKAESDVVHVEGDHHGMNNLKKDEFVHAQQAAIAPPRAPWTVIKESKRCIAAVLSCQIQGAVMGLEYVLLGALVGNQAFCKTMGSYDAAAGSYAVEAWVLSLWAGVFAVMQFAGQLSFSFLIDRFGRRIGIFLTIIVLYVGVAVEIASTNHNTYTGAKIIMGLATGGLQVAVPAYVAEIAPREIRGVCIGLFSFNLSLGALIGSLVTYAGNQAFPDVTDNRGWRVPLYVGLAAPTLALIFQAFTATESPYWLVLKNRRDAAEHNLHRLFPSKTQAEIEDEVNLLVYTVEKEMEERAERASVSFFDCFKGVELRRTFVATLPTLAQQLTGNQLVQSYSTYFFTVAGISDALAASSVVSALGLAGAICAFFIVEKKVIGRFWLVFLGMIAVTICMLGIGVVDSASHGNIGKSGGYVLVFFVGLFNLAVAIGPGVAGWAYTAEAANVRLRAKTTAIATGANAIVGGFWNVVLPYELTAIGPKTGYMFFGIGVLCCIVIWFGIPDLTGRTYAQMDELFERKIPAREFSKTECTGDYGNNEETTV